MKRVPMGGASGGIGHLRGGVWRGSAEVDTRPYVTYQPGCPSISIPGVYYNYSRAQCGQFYQPATITNAVPACNSQRPAPGGVRDHHTPWYEDYYHCCGCGNPCPNGSQCPCGAEDHPCQRGLPCECGGTCKEKSGVGQRHSSNVSAAMSARGMGYAKGTHIRKTSTTVGPWRAGVGGSMGGSCGGGCDPKMGPNWALSGCAPSSRPYGLNWGYQRNHQRWPPNKRVGPFPVSQRPYYVGYAVPTYMEPFAGCPTRGAPYWVQEPCDQPGIGRPGLTKKPRSLGRGGLTGVGRSGVGTPHWPPKPVRMPPSYPRPSRLLRFGVGQSSYPKGTHLRATSVTVGPLRARGCPPGIQEGREGGEGIGAGGMSQGCSVGGKPGIQYCVEAVGFHPFQKCIKWGGCFQPGGTLQTPYRDDQPGAPPPGAVRRAKNVTPAKRGTVAARFSR